ncbi:hypothetical protein [Mucilaginibacter flavus]|uniref:hypothetical protein n=1 Tax=Mucilaginibacter flavus TaxID=931504 RepID=UPI0025B473B2|nr:hypothetical protein [Mucilaginibacter flavus]MDN3581505.1 hypothetical protein [Mucilaginibacter flavus]
MSDFFNNGLHIFVLVAITAFVIFGVLALSGRFDHWDSRLIRKAQQIFSRVRRFFQRKQKREKILEHHHHDDTRHAHHANHVTHSINDGDVR